MKLYDFGLWFCGFDGYWSSTIPQKGGFYIYYHSGKIGSQVSANTAFYLYIDKSYPHIIKPKDTSFMLYKGEYGGYKMRRPLKREDFEVVQNPAYYGDK